MRDYFPDARLADRLPPVGKRIAAFYARQFILIKRMKRFIQLAGFLFLFTVVLGAVFFLSNPEITAKRTSDFFASYIRRHPRHPTPWGTFLLIFVNNLLVSFEVCLAGLIPFFIPSIISLIANAGLLIMILAYLLIKNKPAVTLFFSAILPHGIIEIPTMIFVAGFSLYLSSQMTRRIFRKKGTWTARSTDLFGFLRQDEIPDRLEAFGNIIEVFAGVIVPLVLFAALVETFITPFILRLFA